jgi:hypothetical protein
MASSLKEDIKKQGEEFLERNRMNKDARARSSQAPKSSSGNASSIKNLAPFAGSSATERLYSGELNTNDEY